MNKSLSNPIKGHGINRGGILARALFMFWLIFMSSFTVLSQTTVSGTVTNASDGTPIPGASIVAKGTTVGTSTDIDGKYTLTVPSSATVLVYSFVGKVPQELEIAGRSVIDVQLADDVLEMDEVIVVAYGTTTKEAFTGSAEVIGSKELETRKITNPVSAIEGTTTGVQMTGMSGQPGTSPTLVIRGVGTLNGSVTPLYVVDGAPFDGDLASINPDDIESMTILKDASSTALYGSRAAAGVVMITTKSGKRSQGIQVNASADYGVISAAIPFYDAANPQEYYEIMWQAYKNALVAGGDTEAAAAAEASSTIYNRLGYNPFNVANDNIVGTDGSINPSADVIFKGLDWYDALQQDGTRKNYSLNLSSGGDNYNVYFSTSYLDEESYIITAGYDRFSSRLNASFQAKEWLSLGGSMSFSAAEQTGPFSAGTSSIVNPFGFAKDMGSIYPVYIVDPATGDYILDAAGEKQYDLGGGYPEYGITARPYNPYRHGIAEAEYNNERRMTNNFNSNYFATFTFLPGLDFTVKYTYNVRDYLRKEYENAIVGDGAPTARYNETRSRSTSKNFNQVLTYNKRLDSGHNFDVTLGHENYSWLRSQMYGMKIQETAVGIYEFDNFATTNTLSGSSDEDKLESYFGRVNYNFRDKYYFGGSVRRDGSSRFSTDVRWGTFYSVSGSWRITEENFMKSLTFVDNAKLRGSWGQVGNNNLGLYPYQPLYTLQTNAGNPGVFWSSLGNSALTWETTTSWDVALDFAVMDRLVEGTIEYYERNSTDLLYDVPLPLSVGLSTGPDNIASIVNKGWEFSLTGNIIRKDDLRWSLSFNASTLNNEITDLPDPLIDGSKRWEVGRDRYEYFIYDYAGVDPTNGDALFYMYEENVDDDGNSTFDPVLDATTGEHMTSNDYQAAGRTYTGKAATPDLQGGIQTSLFYKGFQLDLLFTYSIGGYILDYGYASMMNEGVYGNSVHPDLLDAWKQAGDETDIPRLENGNTDLNVSMSTRYLTDASYFALKNASLSYNFDMKFIKDLGIENVKLYVVGENLFLSTERKGLNPQYNLSGTPGGDDFNPARFISAGLNISF